MKKEKHKSIVIRHFSGTFQEYGVPTDKKIFFKLKNTSKMGTEKNWTLVFDVTDLSSSLRKADVSHCIFCKEDKELGKLILDRVYKMFLRGENVFDFYEGPLSKHARNYEDSENGNSISSLFISAMDELKNE